MNSEATERDEKPMDIEWKKILNSPVGRFALEETSGTPHESPDETAYAVYLEVKEPAKEGELLATMEWIEIGELSLQYNTEVSYSQTHGNTHYRSNRQYWCWSNVEFKDISMEQMPTDRPIEYHHNNDWKGSKIYKHPRGYVHASDAITAMFPADQFGTYITAFKHFVKVVAPFVEQAMREDEGELFNPYTMETRLSYIQGDKPLEPMFVEITDDEQMLRNIWDDSFKLLAGRILPVDSFIMNHRDIHRRPQQPHVRIDQSVTQTFGMSSGVGLPPHCYTVISANPFDMDCEDCGMDWIESSMPERHMNNGVCISCADERILEALPVVQAIAGSGKTELLAQTFEMITAYRNRILTNGGDTYPIESIVEELDKILNLSDEVVE